MTKGSKTRLGKKRNEKAARSVSTSERTTSLAASKAPLQAAALTKRDTKLHRQGSKRLQRLETEKCKMNKLVTYLRLSRRWMEFYPSSRHGSGTATYGYIPSSIATFIWSGAISKRTVLDHGTLGVHYVLDWDGYDMFGKNFLPYPINEMMENVQVPDPEWELGDNLPWREMEEAEKLLALNGENSNSVAKIEGDDMEKILLVAGILACLDYSTVADTSDSDKCKQNQCLRNTTADMVSLNTSSPSILVPKKHDSSGGYNSGTTCTTQAAMLTAIKPFGIHAGWDVVFNAIAVVLLVALLDVRWVAVPPLIALLGCRL